MSLVSSATPTATAATACPGWVASAVQSAVAGDEMAFARIVDAYHGDLVRVAYVVAGDEQLAEDAAQSAWSHLAGPPAGPGRECQPGRRVVDRGW